LSSVTIWDADEGTKDGKKRCKQHLQEVTAVANDDGGNGREAGGSDVVCIVTTTGGG
jgi:hypothetical protein